MPIKIPSDLPAFDMLHTEGVQLIGEQDALLQDIRPMQVALLNLMPDKPKTETQLARLLGSTPLQVELTLLTTTTYRPNTVPRSHLQSFYSTWDEVRDRKFDGLVVTGAPVELLPFEEVKYWDELRRLLDWSRTHCHTHFFICWGAQAALYHFHGVPKHTLPVKRFGIYAHHVIEQRDARRPTLLRGLDDQFRVPVSRHTEVREIDLPPDGDLQVLAKSHAAGLCLLHEPSCRSAYMFNHLEYDTFTLHDEYVRDRARGLPDVSLPIDYYPDDDPEKPPRNRWRAYAHLLFGNWINEMYQTTPFDISEIGSF